MIRWKRTIRTPASERLVAQRDGRAVASVDLHYLADGTVSGTVVLLREAGWTEELVPDLLASLDDEFLPDVDSAQGSLAYNVFIGDAMGSYEADAGGA